MVFTSFSRSTARLGFGGRQIPDCGRSVSCRRELVSREGSTLALPHGRASELLKSEGFYRKGCSFSADFPRFLRGWVATASLANQLMLMSFNRLSNGDLEKRREQR
jgi:hypothetical protein